MGGKRPLVGRDKFAGDAVVLLTASGDADRNHTAILNIWSYAGIAIGKLPTGHHSIASSTDSRVSVHVNDVEASKCRQLRHCHIRVVLLVDGETGRLQLLHFYITGGRAQTELGCEWLPDGGLWRRLGTRGSGRTS